MFMILRSGTKKKEVEKRNVSYYKQDEEYFLFIQIMWQWCIKARQKHLSGFFITNCKQKNGNCRFSPNYSDILTWTNSIDTDQTSQTADTAEFPFVHADTYLHDLASEMQTWPIHRYPQQKGIFVPVHIVKLPHTELQ